MLVLINNLIRIFKNILKSYVKSHYAADRIASEKAIDWDIFRQFSGILRSLLTKMVHNITLHAHHKSNHRGKVGIKAWVCPNTEQIQKVSLTPSSFTLFRYCGRTTLVCNKEHQFFSNILDFISLLCHSMKKCFENIFNEEKILV